MSNELTWEAPGPGSWRLLADHYPRPVTRVAETLMDTWSQASTEYMLGLGFPIGSARMATVNGLPYFCIDAGGGSGPKKPPPAWVMKLVVKLMPSLRRSQKRLTQVLTERPWNDGIERWYTHDRAAATERMLTLATVDPDGLTDADLAAHLTDAMAQMKTSMRQHLMLHGHDLLPPGLVAVEAERFGFTIPEGLDLLRGGSPASTGSSPELEQLRALVAGRPVATIDDLRALGNDVDEALDAFLERYGWRAISGYDIDCMCLAEAPALIVRLVTATPPATGDGTEVAADPVAARDAAALARVPAAERSRFEQLLREGRAAYGLRDDNSSILVAWPTGLMRRAVLTAGSRLAATKRLASADLAIEATADELAASLRSGAAMDSVELERRAGARRSLRAADAPRLLGPPEPAMPDSMPGALGTVFRIFAIYEFGDAPKAADLSGVGIGHRAVEGTARLVLGADDAAERFEPGDILVAPMTSPSYNMLLAIAGGVITEEGSMMSHAAIMARELDIPAVLSVMDATRRINDGDRVRVDPVAGRIEILEPLDELGLGTAVRSPAPV